MQCIIDETIREHRYWTIPVHVNYVNGTVVSGAVCILNGTTTVAVAVAVAEMGFRIFRQYDKEREKENSYWLVAIYYSGSVNALCYKG